MSAPETPYDDLGWLNGGLSADATKRVDACKAAGHEVRNVDCGPPHRGLDHQVSCPICRYVYHYDSSD